MQNKVWISLALGVAITAAAAAPVFAASSGGVIIVGGSLPSDGGPGAGRWFQDEGGWYFEPAQGSRVTGSWKMIGSKWYYFGDDGYMLSDAWVMTDGKQYRVGGDGSMFQGPGTIEVNGVLYELERDGAVAAPPKTEEDLQAEAMASRILASITDGSMGKREKAGAIYNYVRGSMTYSHVSILPSNCTAAEAALYGYRRHSGNCYVYYAMSHFLLEMAGMPDMCVMRASDGNHFWNLVNVDDVWYHFDATPYKQGGTWCLVTTGTLQNTWNIHNYDVGAYPATP